MNGECEKYIIRANSDVIPATSCAEIIFRIHEGLISKSVYKFNCISAFELKKNLADLMRILKMEKSVLILY